MMDDATRGPAGEARARDLPRQRSEAYRDRRRRGAVLVTIELERRDVAALEQLALLEPGDRDPHRMARRRAVPCRRPPCRWNRRCALARTLSRYDAARPA